MRIPLRLAFSLLPVLGGLHAQAPNQTESGPSARGSSPLMLPHLESGRSPDAPSANPTPPAAQDPVFQGLLGEALAQNPDLARAAALQAAEAERIPQARALADPTVAVGIQNDGFRKNEIGQMDTSYYQLMVTQPLSWPGKRALRGEIARLGTETVSAGTRRIRLSLEADLRRAYTGLLLNREQARLLEEQRVILGQAEAVVRTRYGVGQGSQADCFRAQLELTRLAQTRLGLRAEERALLAALNRLRGKPLDAPIETTARLETLPDPGPGNPPEAESPELRAADLGLEQAKTSLDLAKLDTRPDFAVTAGIMPRGALEPMWTASVGVSVPLWSGQKQHRAVAEQEQRRQAQGAQARSVRSLLAQREEERNSQLEAVSASLRLYRDGLLVQSEGSFRATMAQYEAGLAPFLAVLEALNGWVADRDRYLQALAQAQAIRIAAAELNLGPTPPIGAGALAAPSLGAGPAQPASTTSDRPAMPPM